MEPSAAAGAPLMRFCRLRHDRALIADRRTTENLARLTLSKRDVRSDIQSRKRLILDMIAYIFAEVCFRTAAPITLQESGLTFRLQQPSRE
jgi:hypothetical protein